MTGSRQLQFVVFFLLGILLTVKHAEPMQQPYGPAPSGGYGGDVGYASEKSGEYEVAYGRSARLVDDYICDLDASILVVTNSDASHQKANKMYGAAAGQNYGDEKPMAAAAEGYGKEQHNEQGDSYNQQYAGRKKRGTGYEAGRQAGGGYEAEGYGQNGQQQPDVGGYRGEGTAAGYGYANTYSVAKAHRLRCSAIAVNSDEDCLKCCHMASRKERSIPKAAIVGFIVDYDELRQPNSGYQPAGPYRVKRQAAAESTYAPAAKPEDYAKEQSAGSNGYGEQEQHHSGGYQQQPTYGANNYNYPQKPQNARCVCCAPKTYAYDQQGAAGAYGAGAGYGNSKRNYHKAAKNANYGNGEGGQQQQNYRPNYQEMGSAEREQKPQGYGENNGPPARPPARQQYPQQEPEQYGGEGGGYGNGGEEMMPTGSGEREQQQYGPMPPKQYGREGGGVADYGGNNYSRNKHNGKKRYADAQREEY